MNGHSHISKTDAALNSLDGIQRADAPPFLYTRIQARLEAGREEEPLTFRDRLAALLAKPAVALACIVTIVTLNVFLIMNRGGSVTDTGNASGELVADAYNANVAITVDETYNNADQ